MTKLLWMTIDRHPDSLKALIRNQLSDAGWEVYEVSYDSIDSLESIPLETIDAVLLAPARHFPVQYMDRLTSCKLMQIWSSGYDKFNIDDAHARGIAVANNHGSNAISVAEHTILMMLGSARRAPEMHNRVTSGNWAGNDHGMSSHSLSGKTLGIVGLGKIGNLVAERAEAFGMTIRFTDPVVTVPPTKHWERRELTHLAEESDFVSLHVHLNTQTVGLINDQFFAAMKRKPFLINVSRAELVDRRALLAAINRGSLSGLAMDAHYEEPTAVDDPLFLTNNSIFSPHVAGSTRDSYEDTVSACISNIEAALATGSISGRIDS